MIQRGVHRRWPKHEGLIRRRMSDRLTGETGLLCAQASDDSKEIKWIDGTAAFFSWNPNRTQWSGLRSDIAHMQQKGFTNARWSSVNRRDMRMGSELFMMRHTELSGAQLRLHRRFKIALGAGKEAQSNEGAID